jgi:predicted methyltransferase
MIPLTHRAHNIVSGVLKPGDIAVDATVGNGHDTVFLAQRVGPTGTVIGFDVQERSIRQTRLRLDSLGLSNVVLFPCSHHLLKETLREIPPRSIQAIMFNLGYLPGGDKAVTTESSTTLMAMEQSLELLAPGGVLTVLAYPGHPAGAAETAVVEQFSQQLSPEKYCVAAHDSDNASSSSPKLFVFSGRD